MDREPASNIEIARVLLADMKTAALGTLTAGGGPFASYVTVAPAADGSPLLLLSKLAAHTRNLTRDPRASLLFVQEPEPGSEMLTAARLTVTGKASPDSDPESRELFLARHADAARYADFGDFCFYRFHIEAGHLVAGFGRIVGFTPRELLRGEPSGTSR
jgi:putative heme iron utilization protein